MKHCKLFSILSLLCCCLLFSACGGSGQGTPVATVQSIGKAMQHEDVDKLMDLLDPAIYAQPGAREKLSGFWSSALTNMKEEKGGVDHVEILEDQTTGDRAVVRAKFFYKNDTSELLEVNLLKVEGKWYLRLM